MIKIITEVELPALQTPKAEIVRINYGGWLRNFLCAEGRRKALLKLEKDPQIRMAVCCRDSARLIADMNFPNLEFIQLTSTGYDGVPLDRLAQKGICVGNMKGTYTVPIAETVVYGLLRMVRKLRSDPQCVSPDPLRRYGSTIRELAHKKVLILGTGDIGSGIAARLHGFQMQVDGFAQSTFSTPDFDRIHHGRDELLEKLSAYDFVISTLPANKNTEKLCDEMFFAHMKSDGIFFNVGRDQTVDADALYKALKNKAIGGAILDMVELLPYKPFNRFRRLKNALVLPGIAASSREVGERARLQLGGIVESYIKNGVCPSVIQ